MPERPLRGYFRAMEALQRKDRFVMSLDGWKDGAPVTAATLRTLRSAGFSPVAAGYIAAFRRLGSEVPAEDLRRECIDELWNLGIVGGQGLRAAEQWRQWGTVRLLALSRPVSLGEAGYARLHRAEATPVLDEAFLVVAERARNLERQLLGSAQAVRDGEGADRVVARAHFEQVAADYITLLEQVADVPCLRGGGGKPASASPLLTGLLTGRLLASTELIVLRFNGAADAYSAAIRQAMNDRSSPEAIARGDREVEHGRMARARAAVHLDAAQAMAETVVTLAESSGDVEILDDAHYWAARALIARTEISPVTAGAELAQQAELHMKAITGTESVTRVRRGMLYWVLAALPTVRLDLPGVLTTAVDTLVAARPCLDQLSGDERRLLAEMAVDFLSVPQERAGRPATIAVLETAAKIAGYDNDAAAVKRRTQYQMLAAQLLRDERSFLHSLALAQEVFCAADAQQDETVAEGAITLMAANLLHMMLASDDMLGQLGRAIQVCGSALDALPRSRGRAEARGEWALAATYFIVEFVVHQSNGRLYRAETLAREEGERYLEMMRATGMPAEWVAAIEALQSHAPLQ